MPRKLLAGGSGRDGAIDLEQAAPAFDALAPFVDWQFDRHG